MLREMEQGSLVLSPGSELDTIPDFPLETEDDLE